VRCRLLVDDLNVPADGRYRSLTGNLGRISSGARELFRSVRGTPVTAAYMPLQEVNREFADVVGGRTANHGEVRGSVGLPVPPG
jgi:hypothetical protein